MSFSRRKQRPLDREIQTYRDDRVYLVACDDTYAPDQYFSELQKHFTGSGARLQVRVVPTKDGTSAAEHVLNRLLEYDIGERDQRWLLLDTDHYIKEGHRKSFLQALTKARQEGVFIAINKPCFEFWLLLHLLEKSDERLGEITNADSASNLLKELLGAYSKRNVDMSHFPISSLPKAIRTGREVDGEVNGGDIPDSNTGRTYLLWEEVIRNASINQLPPELVELKNE